MRVGGEMELGQTDADGVVWSSNDWRPGEARRDGAEQNRAKVRWRDRRSVVAVRSTEYGVLLP